VNDIKLINAGKILENNRTLSECKSPICDFSGMTTMHVVVRAPTQDKQSGKFFCPLQGDAVLSRTVLFNFFL
jgi:tartrate dehydratase alpha subunit/fumarate hydratase class I-like protein